MTKGTEDSFWSAYGEIKNMYNFSGETRLKETKWECCKCDDNIKMNLREICCEDVIRI
jgi:hypothetical protein